MTIYCKKCGAANEDDALFCEKCGAELEKGVSREVRGKKSIGDLFSEALDVITANPMVVILYVVLFVIAVAQYFVTVSAIRNLFRTGDIWSFSAKISGTNIVFDLLIWFIGIFAATTAIVMTYIYTTENTKLSLGDAFNRVIPKAVPLIIVGLVYLVRIIPIIGWLLFLIINILFAFIYQGVLIDNKDIIDAFTNSYEIVKNNFFDVLIVVVIVFVLSLIPVLGHFVTGYGFVALTLLYLDRK